MTCDDATWLDLKSEYDLSAMLRALASKGGSSLGPRPSELQRQIIILIIARSALYVRNLRPKCGKSVRSFVPFLRGL